ncbi:MAG: hypothetical protein WA066_02225 [Candidatus Omnitrophota bacterium]
MTRSKQSLRNAARAALSLLLILILLVGCTSSTKPTFKKEQIDSIIQNICKKEFKLDIKAKITLDTLTIYLPVEDIFVKAKTPRKITEIYKISAIKNELKDSLFQLEYAIRSIPPKEEKDEYEINKDVLDKIRQVLRTIPRVMFSMERSDKGEYKFVSMITADIKTGFEIISVYYYPDLKKAIYNLISNEEYQHRSLQETNVDPRIIGDKEGLHVNYTDIKMNDFISAQIKQRIKLKFQKPELKKNADIDKEILKIVSYVMQAYKFNDFSEVELKNLLTDYKLSLNKAAILGRPVDF